MNNYRAEIKVGLFVLVGIIILAYMSLRVGKFDFGKKRGYEISAFFDNASGLNQDVPVEIAGIEVGRVEQIDLHRGKARVTMRINPDISLPSDSSVLIRGRGLMGDKFIEIVPGTPDTPVLEDGDTVVKTSAPTDIDQLLTRLGDIALDIQKISRSLGNVLGGEEGETKMRQILDNINDTTASLNRVIAENEKRVNALLVNFQEFSEDMKEVSAANKTAINEIVENFRKTTFQLKDAMESFNQIARKIEQGEGSLGRLINDPSTVEDLNRTLVHLRSITEKIDSGEGTIGRLISKEETGESLEATVASLKNITQKIESGEGTIGKLINDEGVAENLEETLEGINDYFTKTDAFKFDVDFHVEHLARQNDIKTYLDVKIQPKADKYYLLGLVSDPLGVQTVTDTVITETPGGTKTIHEERSEKDKLKFSAQIAKRYDDLVLRGGIIESSGGLGVDYYLFDDRLTLTFEAFDFDTDTKSHLKAGVDFSFFKYLYLTAGFDDFISDEGRSTFFLGAGLRFEDDDLKYLLTSAPLPTQ